LPAAFLLTAFLLAGRVVLPALRVLRDDMGWVIAKAGLRR
jgi:hypothetical protein